MTTMHILDSMELKNISIQNVTHLFNILCKIFIILKFLFFTKINTVDFSVPKILLRAKNNATK